MKDCAVELKVSDWQMNTWTSWACDNVKGWRGMADDWYIMQNILRPSSSRPTVRQCATDTTNYKR